MSGLSAAFASGGISADQLQSAFKRLSVSIQQSWSEIQKASRESADNLKGDAISVSNAELGVATTQKALADIGRNQAIQEKQNTDSVAAARLRLRELNGEDVTQQRQALTIREARLSLQQALNKKEDDAANAQVEQEKAANAAQQAVLTLNQARRKEQDDQRNDINNVTDAVKKIASGGARSAIKDINASAENITKGIIKAAADSGSSLTELQGHVDDLGAGAPGVRATFEQLGKVLSNIDDPANKTSIAVRALGRAVSQEFINILSDPSKIDAFIKRINDLGLAVDDVDKQVSEKFRSSLFTLQNDIALVGNKLATAFGPGFTTISRCHRQRHRQQQE